MNVEALVEKFDENLDTLMIVIVTICAIILIAVGVKFYIKDNPMTAPVPVQNHEIQNLTKRGEPGWPPAKEKNRIA